MKTKLFLVFASLLATRTFIVAQSLIKLTLTKHDSTVQVVAKYEYLNRFDGFERIYLFKNKTFKYDYEWTSIGNRFSNGTWEIRGDSVLILNSVINKDSIPVKIKFLDSIKSGQHYNTCFQIPVDLKGELLPDSRIFINDSLTYAFPYFDTVVANADDIYHLAPV